MDGFAFITQTDGSSDKVACAAARKVIRIYVMRTHWASKTASDDALFDVPALKQRQTNKPKLPPDYERRMVLRKDGLA